jgi:hypothetical protein
MNKEILMISICALKDLNELLGKICMNPNTHPETLAVATAGLARINTAYKDLQQHVSEAAL